MKTAALQGVTSYCDNLLRISEVQDYPGAVNGLQVQNRGTIGRIAASVDATIPTIKKAIAAGANLLLVHHGLFWTPAYPWTGRRYEMMRLLLENDVAVYSAHLPLDLHPKYGNNAILARALRLRNLKPFFFSHSQPIGLRAVQKINRSELATRLQAATGAKPKLIAAGPEICRNIGIVTGGAGGDLQKAVDEGADTFVTGEGPHWTFGLAEELGINVLYGGHYATETFGVKALAAHLGARYKLPWEFLDHPTGM